MKAPPLKFPRRSPLPEPERRRPRRLWANASRSSPVRQNGSASQIGHAKPARTPTLRPVRGGNARRVVSGHALPVFALAGLLALTAVPETPASVLATNGTALLRALGAGLDGSGIVVAQPEASSDTNALNFQINPADGNVAQPVSRFVFTSALGTDTNHPNSVGVTSTHASQVASFFFGRVFGVATNITRVDNYDAVHFVQTFVAPTNPPAVGAPVVNQSFIFGALSVPDQQAVDLAYDFVAARDNVLFVSGAGNGGTVSAAATCYNGLGVAALGGSSSVGPTADNGRCKPDLTAPAPFTSFSTPQVAGAAALLLQAGLRGDGGSNTTAAADIRTLKALLLNGAVKPANWTNSASAPLDLRHGAGVVNVFNSWMQLAGGQHAAIEETTVPPLDPHPPGADPTNIPAWRGWDFATLNSATNADHVRHYYFALTNDLAGAEFTFTATLVWNRQTNQTAINDLDLYLYDVATSNLIAESISAPNNVEHLHVRQLPPGRYDLQVLKYGGPPEHGNLTETETYALAWEFFTMPLAITGTETNVTLRWPVYPDGFGLQGTTNLAAPASWTAITNTPAVVAATNTVTLPLTNGPQFFRLKRPMF